MNLDTAKRGVNSALITRWPKGLHQSWALEAESGIFWLLNHYLLYVFRSLRYLRLLRCMRWWFDVDCIRDTMDCRIVSAEPADTWRIQSYGHQKIRKPNLFCFFLQARALRYRPRKPGPLLDPGSRKQRNTNVCWSCWWNELSKAAIHQTRSHVL